MQASATAFEARVEQILATGHGYLLTERENIYHAETLREAAVRFAGLRDRGLAPALTSCRTGELVSWDTVRAYSPHQVLDAAGNVIADSEDGLRDEGDSKIWHVIKRARARVMDRSGPFPVARWPYGESPTVRNLWTGEVLTFHAAVQVAMRGHRG